ncbi:MAG: rhomboid family intramembrane serine protease [Atopococcus tabaci]|uniref:Rhomboid family intramembrane serine protease n=1 Tax=Atopococcus tabaci TaxID=269774 RepID=A0AA43UBN6_9LACT|nr:rhomboid family intramembrane serine protease [Atopococcus tabaci]
MAVMFLVMEFAGGSQDTSVLVFFGAKFNPLIAMGQYWRLITPMFLHIGFLHLVMNGVAIYFLGQDLEDVYGHFRFLLIFLLSGLMGNIFSFAFNNAISAGASTAVFGLFSTIIAMAQADPDNSYLQAVARSYWILIIINIVFNLFSQGVDLAGHLGGFFGGYFVATALTHPVRKWRIGHGVAGVVLAVLIFLYGLVRAGYTF